MSRWLALLTLVLAALVAVLPGEPAVAQDGVTPLRVEVAVTGTLTADRWGRLAVPRQPTPEDWGLKLVLKD